METIWKYKLKLNCTQSIDMPKNARILCVKKQNGEPVLYALVDLKNIIEKRLIEIIGTGDAIMCDMNATRKYIGTFKMESDKSVFHIFESLTFKREKF